MFERNCPTCNSTIYYKNEINKNGAEKKKRKCRKCVYDERKILYSGEGNPFFNKKHTEELKNKFSCERKGKNYSPKTQFKKGYISSYECNPIKIWKIKYDDETYDKKVKELKEKQSKATKGENNPMYGKPSPNGSGNGWSGWYKGWFFRSLGELSYMINVIERFNLKWESAELKKFGITYYDWNNEKRTYFADFIIENKYLVECKPKKLWNSDKNKRKKEGAIIYCNEKKLKYKVTQPRKITYKELVLLYNEGKIKFLKKYDEKFKQYKCIPIKETSDSLDRDTVTGIR